MDKEDLADLKEYIETNRDLDKLENGDFSNLNLNLWFEKHRHSYIYAAIKGCGKCAKKTNVPVLNLIVSFAHELSVNNQGFMSLGVAFLLKEAILVAREHEGVYAPILSKLSESSQAWIRQLCCATCYNKLLNDEDSEVRKTANKFATVNNKYWATNAVDRVYQQRIDFLIGALQTGAIQVLTQGLKDSNPNHRIYNVAFYSLLFADKVENVEIDGYIVNISEVDKLVLADTIDNLINDGVIKIKPDMFPECFSKNKEQTLTK